LLQYLLAVKTPPSRKWFLLRPGVATWEEKQGKGLIKLQSSQRGARIEAYSHALPLDFCWPNLDIGPNLPNPEEQRNMR
jgi:hypothetical protein